MSSIEDACRRMTDAFNEVIALADNELLQVNPDALYHNTSGVEWSIMQVLAHIAEFMPYWAGEIEKILVVPGVKFGRGIEDENRVGAIAEHGNDSLAQMTASLRAAYARLFVTLLRLTDADLDKSGIHVVQGDKTIASIIHHTIIGHLTGHLNQIRQTLELVE
ncbi:MAG: DinB family protein [Chloroflexi bacterium]|uniref:DinB family protein n=1 Tax=Candidatus Chlorohelix allophototropha TaxID=3003348 RepID=A0A8T7M6P8_9CHLR|nr:DinB family protein [Chloroflexota bacterium]WJW69629.1 DinB family protein [Chloroflexota bacterium L227-S17]